MAKQITIRGITSELSKRLARRAKDRGQSVNATVLELLEEAVGIEGRRERLRRYMTATKADAAELEAAVASMRRPDPGLWDR
jgi:plasmid stability protein